MLYEVITGGTEPARPVERVSAGSWFLRSGVTKTGHQKFRDPHHVRDADMLIDRMNLLHPGKVFYIDLEEGRT